MPSASYKTLVRGERYLAAYGINEDSADTSVSDAQLLEAERMAKERIDGWLLDVCGQTLGASIIAEFTEATEDEVDPLIAQLADLYASKLVVEWYEARNRPPPSGEEPDRRFSVGLSKDGMALAARIASQGKTIKADGLTVRRLRTVARESGPAAGGPMSSGSYFDPRGTMNDVWGRSRRLPSGFDPLADAGR